MKTKTLRNHLFIMISLLALAFVSCNQNATGTFTGSNKQPLNITVAPNEMIKFTKNGAGRTIAADPFRADNLTFYLWGTAQSGQNLAPKNVTVTSTDGVVGKVILDIDCYNWSLTLAACETSQGASPSIDTVLENAVLIGYANVDMMFTNSIKFTLTPKGLSKNGGVDLTLQLETGDNAMVIPDGYTANAYIYDITTGEKILGSEDEDLYQEDIDFTTVHNYTANDAEIAPGTYSFQVEFTKADDLRKYIWNDTIIILPGKTVEKTITIPNLIGKKPATPEAFTVEFNKTGSSGSAIAEEADYQDKYVAHFTWNGDNVKTEMNFALELAELSDATAVEALIADPIDDDTAFAALWNGTGTTNEKYTFDYLNDIRADQRFFKDGSLFANNTWVDLYLELGKRYIARLYSENNAGYSEEAAYLTIEPVEENAELTTINRFRVQYWTQGGTWNEGVAHGSEPEGSDLDKIVYWSQSDTPYDVLNPVASTITDGVGYGTNAQPYLYQGPASWIYWIENLDSGTKYPDATGTTYNPVDYEGFKNLNLYASYSREGDIEVYNDLDYDILKAWVSAFGIAASGSDGAGVSKTSTNIVSKGSLTDPAATTVSVALPDTVDWKYDKVSLKISYANKTYFNKTQVGVANPDANTFDIVLTNLPTGYVYNCLITAQYQMTTVSYPFTVYLTD